jgi:cytosine deaminase
MRACFAAVTETPARILGLDDLGIAPGKRADLVLLQSRDPVEAIRLRATRLMVMRAGKIIATTAPSTATLSLPGRPASVSFQLQQGATAQPQPHP